MKQGNVLIEPKKSIVVAKEMSEARSENKKLKEQLEKQSETNKRLTREVEECKSTDTAVLLYQSKYHEERSKNEQIKTQEAAALSLVKEQASQLAIDVLESLQGSDTNLELVQSSTMRPLRLFYVYNIVQRTLGFIFAQTYLKDIQWTGTIDGRPEGKRYPAEEMAEIVKKDMMDKDALDITDVEMFVDRTKAQTISAFQYINSKALKIIREENCRVGIFIVAIGLMISEKRNSELLTKLEAPLTDDKLIPFFHLTCAGEAVSMVQVSTWLANHPEINVALINQFDMKMYW